MSALVQDWRRKALEEEVELLARAVERQVRPGVGFVLVLVDPGEDGNVAYKGNLSQPGDVFQVLATLAEDA